MFKYMVIFGWDMVWDFEWQKRFTEEEWKNILINLWKYPRSRVSGCWNLKEVNKLLKENKLYYSQFVVINSKTNEIVKTNLI